MRKSNYVSYLFTLNPAEQILMKFGKEVDCILRKGIGYLSSHNKELKG